MLSLESGVSCRCGPLTHGGRVAAPPGLGTWRTRRRREQRKALLARLRGTKAPSTPPPATRALDEGTPVKKGKSGHATPIAATAGKKESIESLELPAGAHEGDEEDKKGSADHNSEGLESSEGPPRGSLQWEYKPGNPIDFVYDSIVELDVEGNGESVGVNVLKIVCMGKVEVALDHLKIFAVVEEQMGVITSYVNTEGERVTLRPGNWDVLSLGSEYSEEEYDEYTDSDAG